MLATTFLRRCGATARPSVVGLARPMIHQMPGRNIAHARHFGGHSHYLSAATVTGASGNSNRRSAWWTVGLGGGSTAFAMVFCEAEPTDKSVIADGDALAKSTSTSTELPAAGKRWLDLGAITSDPEVEAMLKQYAELAAEKVTAVIDTGVPSQISMGFASGFLMGYAIKKSLKVMSVVVGLGLIGIQGLAYSGYLKTDWQEMSDTFTDVLDLGKDGKVDSDDAKLMWAKASQVLGYNMPAGSGWATGFFFGLRSG